MNIEYKEKYLKYKIKYKELIGGVNNCNYYFKQHEGECWHDSLSMIFLFSNIIGDKLQCIINSESPDEILTKEKSYPFLLPINIDYTDLFNDDYQRIITTYIKSFITRFKHKTDIKLLGNDSPPESLHIPKLTRGISCDMSILSALSIKDIVDFKKKEKRDYSVSGHGGNLYDDLISVQIINYYFQTNDNKFINTLYLDKDNINKLSYDILSKTYGIEISFSTSKIKKSDSHATCFYKCNTTFYYYDDNGFGGTTSINSKKFDWFDIILKHIEYKTLNILFSDIKDKILSLYNSTFNYLEEYNIEHILLLYEDTFIDEENYYYKLLCNTCNFENFFANKKKYNRLTTLLKSKDIMSKLINNDGLYLEYASSKLCDDKIIVKLAVSQNGLALKYASDDLKNNNKIVTLAVLQNEAALEYASNELKNNFEIVKLAVSKNGLYLRYASYYLRNDYKIVELAVSQNGMALQYASDDFKNNVEICRLAFKQDKYAKQFMNKKIRDKY